MTYDAVTNPTACDPHATAGAAPARAADPAATQPVHGLVDAVLRASGAALRLFVADTRSRVLDTAREIQSEAARLPAGGWSAAQVDAATERILRAAGTSLANYSLPGSRQALAQATRALLDAARAGANG